MAVESPMTIPTVKGLIKGGDKMDASLERIKAKIEKLKAQQEQMEGKYINVVANLVKDLTQKGFDLTILTGMILNANDIITKSPANREAWQVAGQKFLLKAKNQNQQRKRNRAKN